MARPALAKPKDRETGSRNALAELQSALRERRESSRDLIDMLGEQEELLRRWWPTGRPSGAGTEHFDDLLSRRRQKLGWHSRFEKVDGVLSLLLKLTWIAAGLAFAWDRFVS